MMPARPPQSMNFALFFFAYYGYVGVFSPYASLYFADRGLSAVQIGVLMSLMQVMRILDRKSTRLNSSHVSESRMPSSA